MLGYSIDLEYIDPRPEERRETDDALRATAAAIRSEKDKAWEEVLEAAKQAGEDEPVRPVEVGISVVPDWGQSPLEGRGGGGGTAPRRGGGGGGGGWGRMDC